MSERRKMRDSLSSSAASDAYDGSFQALLALTREHLCALLFTVRHLADLFGVSDILEIPDLDSPEGFAFGGGGGSADDEQAWEGEAVPWVETGSSDGSDCIYCPSDWSV